MEKIPSFTIDHNRLLRGIYVSRKDNVGGDVVTTFDIRMKEPNREPALHPGALHTIEHLAATYLQRCTVERPHRVLGTDGMSYGQLSAHAWRLAARRHSRTHAAYIPIRC